MSKSAKAVIVDWGQDLPLLAAWQRDHPDTTLYLLDYFGRCDPTAYGIHYRYPPVIGGGVRMVSATRLQLLDPENPPLWYQWIRGRKPIAVLGGSIYLFQVDQSAGSARGLSGLGETMRTLTSP